MNRMPKAPKIDRPVTYRDKSGELCVISVAEANKRLAAIRRQTHPSVSEDRKRHAREEKALFGRLARDVAHGVSTAEYVRYFEESRRLVATI